MHLSEPFPGMRLWEDAKRESGYKEADPSVGGGDAVQQPFKERETENI